MKICIITVLGYSLFSTILIWLSGALDDTTTNGESLLALACGPVLWTLLILADIVDIYRYFKEKKYILTKNAFDHFVKVKWPMKHLYKNIWLIRFQPGSKFSTWQIHVVKDEAKTLYKKLEEKMKKRIEKFKNEYEYFQTFDIGWSSKKDFYFINATCVNITMKIVFFGILTPQNDELVNKLDKYCRTQIRNQMKKICANGKLSSFERRYISGIEKNRK